MRNLRVLCTTAVKKVYEQKVCVSGYRNKETDEAILVEESLGWFVSLDGFGIAVRINDEELPDIQIGDQILLVHDPKDRK